MKSVIKDIKWASEFSQSFYHCKYKDFFGAFVHIIDRVQDDKYLQDHLAYFTKEMRLVAYRQYLEAYKSVTLEKMA